MSQHERGILDVIPVCANLAIEDNEPGKLFAMLEELLLLLQLYSVKYQEAKLLVLVQVISDSVVTPIMNNEPDIANVVNLMNMLRFFSLLQSVDSIAQSRPILQALHQIMQASKTVIVESYSDSAED